MPELLASAIANALIAASVNAGTALLVAGFIADYGLLIGGLALSSSRAKKAKRDARNAFNAQQVDRLINVSSPIAPRELVLGRVRKGGQVFFKGSTGANKTTFVQLIAIAGHEIDAVEQIYFNDEPVTLDGSGNVTSAPYTLTYTQSITEQGLMVTPSHTPVSGSARYFTGSSTGREGDLAEVTSSDPYTLITYQYTETISKANVRWKLGAAGQTADSRVVSLFPGLWTAAHKAEGVAYLICEFTYDESAFPTGLPNVTAVVRGAKLYDPRTATTTWSQNPALMMRYVYAHLAFGKATVGLAEDDRFAAAADACDTSTGYVVDGVTTTVPLYRASTVAPFGTAAKDLFDDLSQAMAGSWAFAGGSLYLKPGVYTSSVMSLTDADLAVVVRTGASEAMHPISIAVHKERAQKFNVVNVQIWDQAQDYKQVSLTPLKGAALITRDGAELAQALQYSAIGFAPQALHVAGVMMRDARDPLTVVLPFKLRAYPLELFDTVDLTLERYGWSSKLFQILAREWTSEGFLQITLKETSAAIYTMDAAFDPQGYAANTALPSPWYVPLVGALTISSGTGELLKQADGTILTRMRVSWPAITDSSVQQGTVEVQYRSVLNTGAWNSVQVPGDQTEVLITGVQDFDIVAIRARARNKVAVGLWNTQVYHQVVGKTAPPPPFDVFTVGANADGTRKFNFGYTTTPQPVDWLGAEFRYEAGTNPTPTWSGMTRLQNAGTYFTNSPVELNTPAGAGTYTFACKSVDTSGNESSYLVHSGVVLPMESSSLWSNITGTGKPSDYATTDLALIGRAVDVLGNTLVKSATGNVWDSDAYSVEGYTGGAYASARADATSTYIMFGLNTDPLTDASYTSIDYAIYLNGGGLQIYEAGGPVATIGYYAVGDVFAVLYDGNTVQYLQNGTVVRTTPAAAGLKLYFDSSFYTAASRLTNVRFGPLSAVTGIDTNQLVTSAATEVSVATVSSQTLTHPSHTPDSEFWRDAVISVTYTPPVSCNVLVSVAGKYDYTTVGNSLGILSLIGGLNISGSWAGSNDTIEVYNRTPSTVVQLKGDVFTSKRFSCTGGVAYTFVLLCKKFDFGDTVYMTNLEMRVEAIKR